MRASRDGEEEEIDEGDPDGEERKKNLGFPRAAVVVPRPRPPLSLNLSSFHSVVVVALTTPINLSCATNFAIDYTPRLRCNEISRGFRMRLRMCTYIYTYTTSGPPIVGGTGSSLSPFSSPLLSSYVCVKHTARTGSDRVIIIREASAVLHSLGITQCVASALWSPLIDKEKIRSNGTGRKGTKRTSGLMSILRKREPQLR